MSMFFNVNRTKSSDPKPATDFMPYFKADEFDLPDISPEEFALQMDLLFRRFPTK